MKTKQIVLATAILFLTGITQIQAGLYNNLVGYYQFEGGFTSSVGATDGTSVNTPTAGAAGGLVGNAVSLDAATNDHVNVALSFGTGSTLGESFTVSAWYNLNAPPAANGSSRYFVFEGDNSFDVSYGTRNSSLGAAGINDGQAFTDATAVPNSLDIADAASAGWHHVLQTYDASGGTTTIATYVDGVDVGDMTPTTASVLGTGLNLGAARSSVTNRGFDGLLDEIAIWDRVLSFEELTRVYTRGLAGESFLIPEPSSALLLALGCLLFGSRFTHRRQLAKAMSIAIGCTLALWGGVASAGTVPKDALTHYWTFDTDLTDQAGMANGTAIGSGTTVSTADTRVGNGALRIAHDTAAGDYVDITQAVLPTSNPATFSISAWYKYVDLGSQTTDTRNFVWETTPTFTSGFGLGTAGDAEYFYAGSVSDTDGPAAKDGDWHHVVMTWDKPNDLVQFFHDGVLDGTLAIGLTDLTLPTDGFHIGNHRTGDGTRNWDGFIDDFAIFNVALTAFDAALLYNGGNGGFAANQLLVPEPASAMLLGLGCLLMGSKRTRRHRNV